MLKASKRFILCSAVLAMTAFPVGRASADSNIEFEISDGRVIPTEQFAAKVTVLGTAIQNRGVDVPVTIQFRIGDEVFEPFGAHDDPDAGDVNNEQSKNTRHIVEQQFDANQSIDITATSWINGRAYLERNSVEESVSVKVLRDGDDVPAIAGLENQQDVAHYLRNYIDVDTRTMHMDENQVIYLFELGTTNMRSSAADFQDAVVLVTLGESPEALNQTELMGALYD